MNVRAKALVTVLLVGVVVGALYFQTGGNKSLFKGQIQLNEEENPSQQTQSSESTSAKPDLRPTFKVLPADEAGGDLRVDVTIENLGPGTVNGDKTFTYSIYMNDVEIFSNTDSYTVMEAGDSFNFIYPVPRSIYNYPDSGTAKVVVDGDNAIAEENESNNELEIVY